MSKAPAYDDTPSVATILDGAVGSADRAGKALVWLDEHGRSEPGTARELIGAVLPEADADGKAIAAAWLRFHLCWISIDADEYREGLSAIEAAKAAFERANDGEGVVRCLNAQGRIYSSLGLYDLALDHFRDSANRAEIAGLYALAGAALTNMAASLVELGEPEEALGIIDRCVRECPVPPRNLPAFRRTAGRVYHALGKMEDSEREFLGAIEASGGWPLMGLSAKESLAELYIDAGRLAEAYDMVEAGIHDDAVSRDGYLGAKFRLLRARQAMESGRAEDAIADIETAIARARISGLRRIEADAEKAAFEVWRSRGEHAKALAALVHHHELMDAMKGEATACRIRALREDRAKGEVLHFESLLGQMSSISEIGRKLTANLDLDASLEAVYGAINGIMAAPSIAIAVVDGDQSHLDYRLVMVRGERKEPFRVPVGSDSLGAWCVRHRSDILIGDLESEYGRYLAAPPEARYGDSEKSSVFVPLLIGDKVTGMFTVQSPRRDAYDKRTVETVRAIGAYIAIAIENAEAYRKLAETVIQKEVLMKELQHRVKNNLNVILSLINMEMDTTVDESVLRFFANTQGRIRAMSDIYGQLYRSDDLVNIDLRGYLETLATSIFETYCTDPGRIRLSLSLEDARLETKRAVPLGLILNELLSNALKYAYPGESSGEVRVSLRSRDGRLSLAVSDDGMGLPDGFDLAKASSIGLMLVALLARQLGGNLRVEGSGGARVGVDFAL